MRGNGQQTVSPDDQETVIRDESGASTCTVPGWFQPASYALSPLLFMLAGWTAYGGPPLHALAMAAAAGMIGYIALESVRGPA